MSHFKKKHKKYLEDNNIKSLSELVPHIEVLKKEKGLDIKSKQMILDFVYLLCNEETVLKSFFAEKSSYFTSNECANYSFTPIKTPIIEEQISKIRESLNKTPLIFKKCSPQCFCDGSCKNTQSTLTNHISSIINKNVKKEPIEKSETGGIKANTSHTIPKENGLVGIKETQTTVKAPIFTYCKVNKNALEALAFRALYGHEKYNKNGQDEDWQNFSRVPNGDFEYSNAEFRHALEIGQDENEEQHLVASAWNSIARLEIYLRNKKLNKS